MRAFRIVRTHTADAAFTGEGAAKFGGRWNSRGVKIVYTSANEALAQLETIVHLNSPIELSYKLFQIEFDEELVSRLEIPQLPQDWRVSPPPLSAQRMGDEWVRGEASAVLAVPSALIPGERNYLLNPAHPDFQLIRISPPLEYEFDSRIHQIMGGIQAGRGT